MRKTAKAQRSEVLSSIINKAGGEVTVQLISDARNDSFSDYYREYEDLTLSKLKKDINAFYRGGGVREISQFYQRAFAGSRVDYDRPSLEAIGTGEGNQAHGWGLYYALDKDVAEKYREDFERDNYFFDEDKLETERQKQEKSGNFSKTELLEDLLIHHDESNLGNFSDEVVDWYKKEIRPNVLNKNYRKTQVHEVEIPENPFLLDEQLPFSEQPEIVKQGIKNAIKEISEDAEKQIQALENKDFIGREIYNKISLFLAKTPGTLADKETSLLLEKYGIKGISYDGKEDGRAFVIFNPDDVEVIQKFYQEQSVEQAFSPTNRDKNTYISDLRAVERGEDTRIRVGELPIVYRELGLSAGMVRTNKDVIFKDTIGKHDVSQTVVDNLPQLFADPIMVFESSTKENRLLAVVNAQDKNGNQIVVAISPNTKGERGYHFIPSFYGKDNFNNFLNKNIIAGNLKYLKSPQALDSHQLWPQVKTLLNSLNRNILQKSDIVNSFMQQKPQPKGLYDANKGVIKIFESADFSTLSHELAHYWLDNMWRYVRSGNASEKYRQRWNIIANWLNIEQEQAFLTRGQQEKFARGYEQYLLNGNLPTPIIKGAFDDYDRWLKEVYGDMNRLNVRHIDYKKASR